MTFFEGATEVLLREPNVFVEPSLSPRSFFLGLFLIYGTIVRSDLLRSEKDRQFLYLKFVSGHSRPVIGRVRIFMRLRVIRRREKIQNSRSIQRYKENIRGQVPVSRFNWRNKSLDRLPIV